MLALIAGQGRLPDQVARHAKTPLTIAALEGFPPDTLAPDRTFRIERLGSFLAELTRAGVTRACFAGAIRRPPLDPAQVDAATMPLVPRMMQALQQGDDAALRTVLSFFEDAGIEIIGAHQIAPELLPSSGSPTSRQPDAQHERDATRADTILAAIGQADIGQACIVHKGQALAVEAMPGTDHMLKSITDWRAGETGGLLFKGPKPGQDHRIDMPTIGAGTVESAALAGLDGIVIAAGGVLAIDLPEIVRQLDARNMFLWVRG